MTSFVLTAADLSRRRGLQRMRALALSLLVLAGVCYALTVNRAGGWAYLNSASEAAMVGALADWFAVTALFRHPLGLPVPHTAIIPTRKNALGKSLEEFVTGNFLTDEVVQARLAGAELSKRAGEWLTDSANSRRAVTELSKLSQRGLEALDDADVASFVESVVVPRLIEEPVSPIAGDLLDSLVTNRAHHGLIDLFFTEAHRWLTDNEATVARILGERAPKWSPKWVDDLVIYRVRQEALAWVADVRDDRYHPARAAIDKLLAQLATDLQHDPETMQRAEELKVRMLSNPELGHTVRALWEAVRHALVGALADPDGALRQRAESALTEFGRQLVSDEDLRSRMDGYASNAIRHVVTTYRAEITAVISQTIDRWDGKEAAERIELHVGRDLQFIRINGTLVGAIVGLLIHAFTVLA
ncbi:MAG: DUF445 domain-containing protein [Nocardioidaceae bacterium]